MKNFIKIEEVAKYVIKYHNDNFGSLTHLKLQKLLFYIYVWGICSKTDVINQQFIKWEYGPVNKAIWQLMNKYKDQPIPNSEGKEIKLDNHKKSFIDFILDSYSPFTAFMLSAMTHGEDPWIKSKKDGYIKHDIITSYYNNLSFAKNFPLDLNNKPYYPVFTEADHAFVFDMDDKTAEATLSYPSFKAYKEDLINNKTIKNPLLPYLKAK